MTDDHALLREYALKQSDAAFATLTARYAGLVYSAALRQVGDPHLAEDVAQAVFVVLAEKAATLSAGTTLPAWLLSVTRLVASNARRSRNNQRKSAEAAMNAKRQQSASEAEGADWGRVAPLLDEGVAELSSADRDAVVLRFFQKNTFEEVGGQLGITGEAAKKRVSRALEKLRQFFAKKGVSASALALSALISDQAVQAAPAALAANISAAVVSAQAGVALTQSTVLAKGAMHTMAVLSAKKIVAVAALVVLSFLGGGMLTQYFVKAQKAEPDALQAAPIDPVIVNEEIPAPVAPLSPLVKPAFAPTAPVEPAAGMKVVNLMSKLDLDADVVSGFWTQDKDGVRAGESAYARLEFPYTPSPEYNYKVEFTVHEANQDVKLICSHNDRVFAWLIGFDGNTATAIDYIGNTKSGRNVTRRELKTVYTAGQRIHAEIQIRNTGLAAYLNGKLVTFYDTDYKDLYLTAAWKLSAPNVIGIGGWLTSFTVHAAEVVEVSGRGYELRKDGQKGKARWKPELTEEKQWEKAVNLLPLIKPERDAVVGRWTMSEQELTCAPEPFARLELPYRPPEEYDYKMVYTVASGTPELHQIAAQGKKAIQFCLSGWNIKGYRNVASFQAFDRFKELVNPSSVWLPEPISLSVLHTSIVQVRGNSLAAFMDGKLVSVLTIDMKDARLLDKWVMPTHGLLGVGANECAVTIKELSILELKGKGATVESAVAKSTLPLPESRTVIPKKPAPAPKDAF